MNRIVDKIKSSGPDRVVISASGETTTSLRAIRDYRVIPDIIFIRKDGWTLAAPNEFRNVAYDMWRDEWVGFMVRPSDEVQSIERYAP